MFLRESKNYQPSQVIIRPEKENFEVPSSENIIPDFQEVNPLNSWPSTDEGIMEEVTLNQNGSEEKKLPVENFEEIMEGIDKEIKKFDSTTSEKPGFRAKTGKENCVDSLCINEITLNQNGSEEQKLSAENFEEIIEGIDKEIKNFDSTTSEKPGFGAKIGKENCMDSLYINESCEPNPITCAPYFSSLLRVPLLELPISLNNHVHVEGTWKRLTRVEVGSNVVMSNVVGEKRNAGRSASPTEFPKKRRVSQGGATKNKILAEAGY